MRTHFSLEQRNQNKGFVLLFVLILLIGLMITSAGFFYRANDDTKLSGTERDYDQALLLAEAGGNLVAGRFFNACDPTVAGGVDCNPNAFTLVGCPNPTQVGDMDCDGRFDNPQGRPSSAIATIPNPTDYPVALGYEFFLHNPASANAGITESAPGILQRIADGEARNSGANITSRQVLTTQGNLRVQDLFTTNLAPGGTAPQYVRPLLFVQNANGLTRSTLKWQNENAQEKVAVWLEITRNPNPNNTEFTDLYLCSVAKVGNAKSYLMRYIGSYTNLAIGLPAIGEAH